MYSYRKFYKDYDRKTPVYSKDYYYEVGGNMGVEIRAVDDCINNFKHLYYSNTYFVPYLKFQGSENDAGFYQHVMLNYDVIFNHVSCDHNHVLLKSVDIFEKEPEIMLEITFNSLVSKSYYGEEFYNITLVPEYKPIEEFYFTHDPSFKCPICKEAYAAPLLTQSIFG